MDTPLFPDFLPAHRAPNRLLERLRHATLSQLENLLGCFLPIALLSQADEGPNSRERIFTLRRTFWGFLFQVLNPKTSCREVALQVCALLGLHGGKSLKNGSGAYCQARDSLPVQCLEKALQHTAQAADERA